MATAERLGLVHDAFVYTSDEEFLAGTLPFLEEGIDNGDPILAAPTRANAELLRRKLGDKAARVDWAEDAERHRAVERLGIFLHYIDEGLGRGAERIRLLGEPCWPAQGGAGVTEWKRYESFLNVALAQEPVWLVCPYDGRVLARDILDDACRTHPNFGYGDGRAPSAAYVEPEDFARRLNAEPLAPPPRHADENYFDSAAEARRFVGANAAAAGLSPDQVRDAELAASEVATNVFLHAADVARVRTWKTRSSFVCEVDDTGPGIDDPFAGYTLPEPTSLNGRGLPLARRVADVVEVRRTPTGTTVRVHFYFMK